MHTLLAFVGVGSAAVVQLAVQHVAAIATVVDALRRHDPACPNLVCPSTLWYAPVRLTSNEGGLALDVALRAGVVILLAFLSTLAAVFCVGCGACETTKELIGFWRLLEETM